MLCVALRQRLFITHVAFTPIYNVEVFVKQDLSQDLETGLPKLANMQKLCVLFKGRSQYAQITTIYFLN